MSKVLGKAKGKCSLCGYRIKGAFVYWYIESCALRLHKKCAVYLGHRLISDANGWNVNCNIEHEEPEI